MAKSYLKQSEEIHRLCNQAKLTPDQMAEFTGLKSETMRKVLHGYQVCSVQMMQSFRNVVELRRLRGKAAQLRGDGNTARAARFTDEIQGHSDAQLFSALKESVTGLDGTGRSRRIDLLADVEQIAGELKR